MNSTSVRDHAIVCGVIQQLLVVELRTCPIGAWIKNPHFMEHHFWFSFECMDMISRNRTIKKYKDGGIAQAVRTGALVILFLHIFDYRVIGFSRTYCVLQVCINWSCVMSTHLTTFGAHLLGTCSDWAPESLPFSTCVQELCQNMH